LFTTLLVFFLVSPATPPRHTHRFKSERAPRYLPDVGGIQTGMLWFAAGFVFIFVFYNVLRCALTVPGAAPACLATRPPRF
jgi:hypothetical protein